MVRVPEAVEAREARGGQRLVHRSPVLHPRVALRDATRVGRELLWEPLVEQRRLWRTAPVVDEPDDRTDVQLAEPLQPLVAPAPVMRSLPEDRVADRGDAQPGEPVEIVESRGVAAGVELVEVRVADAVDGRLDPGPDFERHRAQPPARTVKPRG